VRVAIQLDEVGEQDQSAFDALDELDVLFCWNRHGDAFDAQRLCVPTLVSLVSLQRGRYRPFHLLTADSALNRGAGAEHALLDVVATGAYGSSFGNTLLLGLSGFDCYTTAGLYARNR
jgi:hypothetical protein